MSKLYRSTRDKKIFGLCGGLAESLNIDATILRLIVAIGVVLSGGTVLLLYIVASLVIPKEPTPYNNGADYSHNGYNGNWNNHSWHQPHTPPTPPPSAPPQASQQQPSPNLDDMMKDIEKKAMQKEIEELKARLAKLEKGE